MVHRKIELDEETDAVKSTTTFCAYRPKQALVRVRAFCARGTSSDTCDPALCKWSEAKDESATGKCELTFWSTMKGADQDVKAVALARAAQAGAK